MYDCGISVFWRKAGVYFNVIFRLGLPIRSFFSSTPVNTRDCIENLDLKRDLENYFCGIKIQFDHWLIESVIDSINAEMGNFTAKVLKKVLEIPYGETRTYSEISKELRTSPRAVGQAVKRNPLPVIIPCHRVTGTKDIGGYSAMYLSSEKSLEVKRLLLELEGLKTFNFSECDSS
jgi:methylated-DNA-[protein]-cysteine S-methyltransferase